MRTNQAVSFQSKPAICYSGYRTGQSPAANVFPDEAQILEDLTILADDWHYLRLYDPNLHAQTVLDLIRKQKLDLKVLLGTCLEAELSNPQCPWFSEPLSQDILDRNALHNEDQIHQLIRLANDYPDVVFAISIGNEATVEWSDHLVAVDRVIEFARKVKKSCSQPVTFCENYIPWLDKLQTLVPEIDFISIHTYPVWEYKGVDEAIRYTEENYNQVKNQYPEKVVIITEAGWPTRSNGRGIPPENASVKMQQTYFQDLMQWSRSNHILTFYFEAFDEPWKGSPDPGDPEKHWGLYSVERTPKQTEADK